MHVRIISAERAVYDGEADAVVVPAFDGEVGILPRHAPLMTLLGKGAMTVRNGADERVFDVRGGFLQVVNDKISVVAEHAEAQEKGSAE
jgi:F-type H+-transporting ATPase subunit epsilon